MSGLTNQYIYTRVWEIFETLHPKPDDLISTSRFFVREGEMFLWDEKKKKKKKRYFFLFNDILLLCRKESHKRFWLRIHITLRSPYVSIEDIENSSYNNEFRLHCRSRSFILYASSPDQKKDWIQDLQHSISGTHKEEKKDDKDKKEDDKEDPDKKGKRKSVHKLRSLNKKGQQNDDPDDDDESPDTEDEEPPPPPPKSKPKSDSKKSPRPKGAKNKTPRKEAPDPFGPTPTNVQRLQTNPFGPTNPLPAIQPANPNPFFPQPTSPQFGNPFGNSGAFSPAGVPASQGYNPAGNPFQPQFGSQLQPVLNPFVAQPVAPNPFTPAPVNPAPVNPFLTPNATTNNPNFGQPFSNNLF